MLAAVYPRMQARRLRYNKGDLAVLRDRATEEESPALLLHKTVRGFLVSPARAPRSGISLVFAAEDSMIPVWMRPRSCFAYNEGASSMISNGIGCFLMGMSAFFGAADGLLGMDKPLRIVSVEADRAEARIFERLTLDITLEASYINPFGSREIQVDVEASPVGGESFTVPAFLYQPFERQLIETEKGAQEVLAAAGEPRWQARLSFPEAGRYVVRVTASDKSGAVSSDPVEITVSPADVAGMARTHPEDHRYFVTDRGETLYLNGANVCWGGARGTYNYDDWLARYAESNCNFFRVWLSPSWTTFAMNTHESGYDGIAMGNAWRLDYVLEQAERLGLRIMICVDSFNVLRSKETLYGA